MPRLIEVNEIVWGIAKLLFMIIYTASVLCACVATVIMNVMLAGNAGGIIASYALIGVLILVRWLLFPKKEASW